MSGWRSMPRLRLKAGDTETIREIAVELAIGNMHFHEVAIADPFEAERYVQSVGERLLAIVGWPKGYRIYESPEQPAASGG